MAYKTFSLCDSAVWFPYSHYCVGGQKKKEHLDSLSNSSFVYLQGI